MNRVGLLAASMLVACTDAFDPEMEPTSRVNPANAGGVVDVGNGTVDAAADARPTSSDAFAGAGTSGDGGGAGPADHTLFLGGIAHRPGNTDPLKNCVSCHGTKLEGSAGRSCYSCHNNADHGVDHKGKKHKSGANDTCASCHGPNNSGGLGKACSTCHTGEPGSAPADHTVNLGGAAHRAGQTDPRRNCVSCHGANLRGGTGTNCYSCHSANDHLVFLGGRRHHLGRDCASCHGPNNSGGLGPACADCHDRGD